MADDNKMWEGHRIIYPELRDRYLKLQKKSYPHPAWDEQALELLEYMLSLTLARRSPVVLTLWSQEGSYQKEVIILKKEIRGNIPVLKCRDNNKNIVNIPLAEIFEITPGTNLE